MNAAVMIKDLLTDLTAAGKTVVYSSHVLDVVERICDRTLIIHQGHLIADSATDALKTLTGQPTLEAVFREMTGATTTAHDVSRIIDALGV